MKTKLILLLLSIRGLVSAQSITADFSNSSVCFNSPTCFTDLSTSPSYSITTWWWDFGNGSTSTVQNPCHTYPMPGTYTVTLIATNNNGNKDTVAHPIVVYNNPIASFSGGPFSGNANFTDLSISSDGSVSSWYWSFPGGNPSTATSQNPTNISYPVGTYTACLTVTTNFGCLNSTCQTVVITSINEIYLEAIVNIFPNPFSTQITLHADINFKDATLIIYNLYGQQVKQIINISGQTITLQRDNLPSGLYFIRLTQDGKIIATDKLVITDK